MARVQKKIPKPNYFVAAALACCFAAAASAQVPVDDDGFPVESLGSTEEYSDTADQAENSGLSAAELQVLVGPIALYPDDLLAIVLPASTYPLEIVQAARFLEAFEEDKSLKPDEEWDESVIALLNYPDVVRLLDDDIDWTWKLGDAVINQQDAVISAVEQFRDRAYAAGNLKSDEHQSVNNDEGIIEIVPIEDDVIYVPYYEPERVVVRQTRPVYYYYSQPCPVYYYPYPSGYAFSSGYFWGVTTAFRIGWANNHLRIHHPSYWGHPYYGRSYFGHYYRRPSISVYNNLYVNNRQVNYSRRSTTVHHRDGDHWRSRRHAGSRPSEYRSRYRSNSRQYRSDRTQRSVAERTSRNRSTRHSVAETREQLRRRSANTGARDRNTAQNRDVLRNRDTVRRLNTGRTRDTASDRTARTRDTAREQRRSANRASQDLAKNRSGRSQTTPPARQRETNRTRKTVNPAVRQVPPQRQVRNDSARQQRRTAQREAGTASQNSLRTHRSTRQPSQSNTQRTQRESRQRTENRQRAQREPRQRTENRQRAQREPRQPTENRQRTQREPRQRTENRQRESRQPTQNKGRSARSSDNRERRTRK